jgi:hypothetical protein
LIKLLVQELAPSKKKAKYEACIETLKMYFPALYNEWISINEDKQKMATSGK